MGTRQTNYLFYGVKFDYTKMHDKFNRVAIIDYEGALTQEEDFSDVIEAYRPDPYKMTCNHHDGLSIIYDGMSGKYIMFGHVVYMGNSEGSNIQGPLHLLTEPVPVNLRATIKIIAENLGYDEPIPELGWIFLEHFS